MRGVPTNAIERHCKTPEIPPSPRTLTANSAKGTVPNLQSSELVTANEITGAMPASLGASNLAHRQQAFRRNPRARSCETCHGWTRCTSREKMIFPAPCRRWSLAGRAETELPEPVSDNRLVGSLPAGETVTIINFGLRLDLPSKPWAVRHQRQPVRAGGAVRWLVGGVMRVAACVVQEPGVDHATDGSRTWRWDEGRTPPAKAAAEKALTNKRTFSVRASPVQLVGRK